MGEEAVNARVAIHAGAVLAAEERAQRAVDLLIEKLRQLLQARRVDVDALLDPQPDVLAAGAQAGLDREDAVLVVVGDHESLAIARLPLRRGSGRRGRRLQAEDALRDSNPVAFRHLRRGQRGQGVRWLGGQRRGGGQQQQQASSACEFVRMVTGGPAYWRSSMPALSAFTMR